MKPLPELPAEMKALTTATLIFAGLAVLAGLTYIDVSHRGVGGSFLISPADIAATYYGPGVGVVTLISLAHIHMMGLLTVFWVIGYIFVHSSYATGWKAFLSVLPFAALLVDVSGWFLTRMNPGFVYVTITAGALFMLALDTMILLSLFDIWITPVKRARAGRLRAVAGGAVS